MSSPLHKMAAEREIQHSRAVVQGIAAMALIAYSILLVPMLYYCSTETVAKSFLVLYTIRVWRA